MSKNKKQKKIEFNNFFLTLIKAEYNFIESEVNSTEKINFKIDDAYSVKNINKEKVVLEFIRSVYFEPRALYEIEVNYELTYEIADDSKKHYSEEKVRSTLNELDEDTLLYPAISNASSLISMLIKTNSEYTRVTPPYYLGKKEKKQ